MNPSLPDVRFLESHFDFPAERWVDACYPLAHSIVRELTQLGARVCEGVWTGVVAEGTHFRWLVDQLKVAEVAHWWLELPDGTVMDPTRWVFEGVEPYVYYGSPDFYIEKRLGRASSARPRR
jgi:hypothetical protein